ncbi:MAG TPA: Flp pilus assembly protein CpaB [Solirubrobacter sp.]|nr:Flp pilus assembly protein CpaB [Solirubrobacter sp.]
MLLLAIAVAGLLGTFALVASYVSDVETEVGDKIAVLELTKPVAANRAISDDMYRAIDVPRKWAPKAALTDPTRLVGVVAAADLEPNSILQEGMLTTPPDINQGEREVAILVDASTGVAGKIEPGRRVDVIASYAAEAGDADNGVKPRPARSIVIVPGARVIAVGEPRAKAAGNDDAQADPGQVVPVTFALDKTQELRVAHAQTFAADVRLALLRRGDAGQRTAGETIFRGEDPKG